MCLKIFTDMAQVQWLLYIKSKSLGEGSRVVTYSLISISTVVSSAFPLVLKPQSTYEHVLFQL